MTQSSDIAALKQRLSQLQQNVEVLSGRADSADRLAAVQVELASIEVTLRSLGVQITQTTTSGINLGVGNNINSIGNLVIDNKTVITEEQQYNVNGLPNPYLGLQAFTASERDIFGGREQMVQSLVTRLAAEDGDRLLFLVGASGSGKSSLARAGVLPALEEHLRKQGQAVETRILDRPGRFPTSTIARLTHEVSLPPGSTLLIELLNTLPRNKAPRAQESPAPTLLLLIDQFEELFVQSEPSQARRALNLLLSAVGQTYRPMRIIATLRNDFLPQLAADVRFEPYIRRVVFVRVMEPAQLVDAIQRPVQVRYPDKRLAPGLVKRLVKDASQDASYLPLLQVTLEELWRGGSMRSDAYSNLGDAIQERAEKVFDYRDYDDLQSELRSQEEQEALIKLLLDLVRVPLGEDQRKTRWRRTRTELTHNDPLRQQLIAELTAARLLRTDSETEIDQGQEHSVETVDVVHESLLDSWPRLKNAISKKRDDLLQRERFLVALQEWQSNKCSDDYLLQGVRLAEAEALKKRADSVLSKPQAQPFYERSIAVRDQAHQRQTRLQRIVVAVLSMLTILALIAAVLAGQFNILAQQQLRVAESRRLVVEVNTLLVQGRDSELALLLAIEAVQLDSNPATRQALQQAVAARPYSQSILFNHDANINTAVFSPNGQRILTASYDKKVHLWDDQGGKIATLNDDIDNLGNVVKSAVFSSNGRHILTASWDSRAYVWDSNGNLIDTLQGHTGPLTSAVFSPDGQWIVTTSIDTTARVWQVLDGKVEFIAVLKAHTGVVNSATFSPDGNYILTASDDTTARLWDRYGNSSVVLEGHTGPVKSAVFSPNGKLIVTASHDATARLWDRDGNPRVTFGALESFDKHTGPVNSAVFSPDGKHILTASYDGTARLWDESGLWFATLRGHSSAVTGAVFSPNGQRILTASDDGTARLWNENGMSLAILKGHTSIVTNAVFSPDGKAILTASNDKTARLWKEDSRALAIFTGHTHTVNRAVFDHDGQRILTGSRDQTARLWDADGSMITTLISHTNTINAAEFSPDGRYVLTASSDTTARLWDVEGSLIAILKGHSGIIYTAQFSLDGSRILTASSDQTARLWDSQGNPIETLRHAGDVIDIAFRHDGERILTASTDKTAGLWDRDGKPLKILTGHNDRVNSVIFSPNGQFIVTASADKTARLWDANGTFIKNLVGHQSLVRSAVFSSDSQRILTASDDNTARLWNLNGEQIAILSGHSAPLSSAVFSPNGNYMLTTSNDATARLWDREGRLLVTLSGHTEIVERAVFSPDGKRILTASSDGNARLWSVEVDDWLLTAECRVSRTLTESEIGDYQVPTPLRFDRAAFANRQCPPKYGWQR